jgi:uncharacterized membrane protein
VIRTLLRVAVLGAVAAWVLDRVLGRRAVGMPPTPIQTSVVIQAPAERVWAELADIERQPRWLRDLPAVRVEGGRPVGVGTRAVGDVRILGLTVLDPITITVFEPPRRFSIRHEGTFRGEGDIRLDPAVDDASTLVRWSETLVPPALPNLAAVLLEPVFRRVFQADLERLRDLVESGRRAD